MSAQAMNHIVAISGGSIVSLLRCMMLPLRGALAID
jgi:hypothetical protein